MSRVEFSFVFVAFHSDGLRKIHSVVFLLSVHGSHFSRSLISSRFREYFIQDFIENYAADFFKFFFLCMCANLLSSNQLFSHPATCYLARAYETHINLPTHNSPSQEIIIFIKGNLFFNRYFFIFFLSLVSVFTGFLYESRCVCVGPSGASTQIPITNDERTL